MLGRGSCNQWCSPGECPGSYLIHFINDMPEILKCFIKIPGDDSKVYTAVQSEGFCKTA